MHARIGPLNSSWLSKGSTARSGKPVLSSTEKPAVLESASEHPEEGNEFELNEVHLLVNESGSDSFCNVESGNGVLHGVPIRDDGEHTEQEIPFGSVYTADTM